MLGSLGMLGGVWVNSTAVGRLSLKNVSQGNLAVLYLVTYTRKRFLFCFCFGDGENVQACPFRAPSPGDVLIASRHQGRWHTSIFAF